MTRFKFSMESGAVVTVASLAMPGLVRPGMPVVGHTLPQSAGVDGLLGLDFFSDTRLTIDFRGSFVEVTQEQGSRSARREVRNR